MLDLSHNKLRVVKRPWQDLMGQATDVCVRKNPRIPVPLVQAAQVISQRFTSLKRWDGMMVIMTTQCLLCTIALHTTPAYVE